MNVHSDQWIMDRLHEHYEEALKYFPEKQIVGIFLQGSQNYGLDYEGSDVDTKLIVVPSVEDLIFNKPPVSTTHIRDNNEHIDFKDVRLYMQTFRKQNLNFMEILFTPYKIVNPAYEYYWNRLERHREEITHYDPKQAIKSMRGIAKEKYFAMEHRYPSKVEVIDKYGYDFKQLHHLLRVKEYIERYVMGDPYEDCLHSKQADYLFKIKTEPLSLEEARALADAAIASIDKTCDEFLELNDNHIDMSVELILNDVQYHIMYEAIYWDYI